MRSSIFSVAALSAATLLLASCGGGSNGNTPGPSPTSTAAPTASPTPATGSISGTVRGGQNPIAGSTLTLVEVGSNYGSRASILGTATSDSNGNFTLPFNCPADDPETYITAIGGDAGQGVNSAIGMMTLTGPCSALAASTTVSINELTTVAAQWALTQFTDSSGTNIGAPAGNSTGLQNAYTTAANLAESNGEPSSFLPAAAQCSSSPPRVNCGALEKLDTLANIVAACVAASGPGSSACTALFAGTSTPPGGTTLEAVHAIAANPAGNVAALFALQGSSGNAPFQPSLQSAPNDWTLAINLSGGGLAGPSAIAIDASGNAWVANDGGVVVKFAPAGKILSGASGFTGGGFAHSFGIAIDASGNAWVTNKYTPATNGTVTKLSPSGAVLSGASGYTAGGIDYPLSIATDSAANVWVANYGNSSVTRNPQSPAAANFTGGGLSFPVSLALDASDNIWIANFGNDSVSEFSSGGSPLSPADGFTAGGLDGPAAIQVDKAGNAWIANYYGDSVTALNPSGAALSGSPYKGGGLDSPAGLALDGNGNVWVSNYRANSITGLAGASASTPGVPQSGTSGYIGGGLAAPTGLAIDASGNLWVVNFDGDSVTEFVGIASPHPVAD